MMTIIHAQMESLAPYRNKILELSEAEQFGVVVCCDVCHHLSVVNLLYCADE